MSAFESIVSLHSEDLPRTLFPLFSNQFLIERGTAEISDYIHKSIGPSETSAASFLSQERVYAVKAGLHLRRTHKLDPVAEYFLYETVYRHRTKWRGDFFPNRRSFGYRFKNGVPISPSDAYSDFRQAVTGAALLYKFYCRFDISSYFNSLYHHDLSHWFEELAESPKAAQLFGKFLRQINSGRSIDCLTQGILPAKIIGSQFLKYVDGYPGIKSPLLLRFMDDFYLFADDWRTLGDDFLVIQRLLGDKGLSVNPTKTSFGEASPKFVDSDVNEVRLTLLKRKRQVFRSSDELEEDDDETVKLSPEEMDYLLSLLRSPNMDEDDAELVLALMREDGNALVGYLGKILESFPHLARNVAVFCDYITDDRGLLDVLVSHLKRHDVTTEYQLFWIARIVESKLLHEDGVGELITLLYQHESATKITRAKLLEISTNKFGLKERRAEQLRSGCSDWLSWSAAVGARNESRSSRNHALGYFANGSQMNQLIATIIQKE